MIGLVLATAMTLGVDGVSFEMPERLHMPRVDEEVLAEVPKKKARAPVEPPPAAEKPPKVIYVCCPKACQSSCHHGHGCHAPCGGGHHGCDNHCNDGGGRRRLLRGLFFHRHRNGHVNHY